MKNVQKLCQIMAQLRDPKTGCPWDVEQNFASIAPYTLEEAYEVADAIEQNDMEALKEELGDLLLQVVFHAQMAKEKKLFDMEAVAEAINTKLIARHPHVFGEAEVKSASEQETAWEAMKAKERAKKTSAKGGTLEGVALALPSLTRAYKLQKRAAKVGFDWPDIQGALDKLHEELAELEEALPGNNPSAIEEELGDVLFSVVNIARKLKIDPEQALRNTNRKFERRFSYVEQGITAQGKILTEASLEEMDALWDEAKHKE